MSDTPRTDEFATRMIGKTKHVIESPEIDFARQLERELAQALKDKERLDWLESNAEELVRLNAKAIIPTWSIHLGGRSGETVRGWIDAVMKGATHD